MPPGPPTVEEITAALNDPFDHDYDLILTAAQHPDPTVRALAAERLGDEDWFPMLTDPDPGVRAALAGNERLDEFAVDHLARDPHPGVRAVIAWRHDLSDATVRLLTGDPDPAVAANAANAVVSGDPYEPGRSAAVAGITATRTGPTVLVWYSATPPGRGILPTELTGNPTARAQARLLTSDAYEIRHWTRSEWRDLATPTRLDPARRAVIAATATSRTLLTRLARDPDRYVRETVVRNQHTDATALTRLAADSDPDVRAAVAANPNADATALTRLTDDPDPGVRAAVAANPHTDAATLTLLTDDPSEQVRAAVTARLLREP